MQDLDAVSKRSEDWLKPAISVLVDDDDACSTFPGLRNNGVQEALELDRSTDGRNHEIDRSTPGHGCAILPVLNPASDMPTPGDVIVAHRMTAPASEAEPGRLRISVVVCTYNRAEKLANCLERLTNQTLDRSSYEIVVVDDCSTDGTRGVAEGYATRVVRTASNVGPAAGRNAGIKASGATIVAFTDDDCVPDSDWLEELLKPFGDPEVLAVGGKITPLRTDRLLLRYYEANNPLAHNPAVSASKLGATARFAAYLRSSFRLHSLPECQESLLAIASANMGIRRSALELTEGFDEQFRAGGEDDDLCLRLRRLRPDGRLVYASAAVVAHDYDPSVGDGLRRSRAYGHAAGIAYLKGDGRLPAIFPFPFLIALSLALAAINPAFLVVPVVLVLILYPGWIKRAIERRRPSYLGFGLLQAVFELQTTIGFLGHLIATRRTRPAQGPSAD
jgi:GT2 family glycosyltransferase